MEHRVSDAQLKVLLSLRGGEKTMREIDAEWPLAGASSLAGALASLERRYLIGDVAVIGDERGGPFTSRIVNRQIVHGLTPMGRRLADAMAMA